MCMYVMLENEDVKPCFHCGNSEGLYIVETDTSKWCAVSCPNCEAKGGEVRSDYFHGDEFKKRAIDAWNARDKKLPTDLIERLGYDAYSYALEERKNTPLEWAIRNRPLFTFFFTYDIYRRFFDTVKTAELARSF